MKRKKQLLIIVTVLILSGIVSVFCVYIINTKIAEERLALADECSQEPINVIFPERAEDDGFANIGDYVRCERPIQDTRIYGMVSNYFFDREGNIIFEVLNSRYYERSDVIDWTTDLIAGSECEPYRNLFSKFNWEQSMEESDFPEIHIGGEVYCVGEVPEYNGYGTFKKYNAKDKTVEIR
jgi:hypothetical protein